MDVSADRSMAKNGKHLAVIFLATAAAMLSFLALYGSDSVRYRLTYDVEVDGQVRSGSGVVEVGSQVTGEAIVIELGEGRYLFSLLAGRLVQFNSWSTHATSPDKLLWLAFDCGNTWGSELYRCLNSTMPSTELPFMLLPALATFEDINDPASLRLVDPEDLAAYFGPGISLKRVTIEITNDPVTNNQIGNYLDWLENWSGSVNTGERTIRRFHFKM